MFIFIGVFMNQTSASIKKQDMKLGAFSMSLAVKDLKQSKEFYEQLGFERLAGSPDDHYHLMIDQHR